MLCRSIRTIHRTRWPVIPGDRCATFRVTRSRCATSNAIRTSRSTRRRCLRRASSPPATCKLIRISCATIPLIRTTPNLLPVTSGLPLNLIKNLKKNRVGGLNWFVMMYRMSSGGIGDHLQHPVASGDALQHPVASALPEARQPLSSAGDRAHLQHPASVASPSGLQFQPPSALPQVFDSAAVGQAQHSVQPSGSSAQGSLQRAPASRFPPVHVR